MDILDGITTTAAVRAAIGVTEASGELMDQVFTDLNIDDLLLLELLEWLPVPLSDPSLSSEMAAIALTGASTYWCAYQILQSIEIGFATKHEDGQNAYTRRGEGYEKLIARILAMYEKYRARLEAILIPDEPVAATATFFGVSRPTYDPVTNT